MKLHETIQRFYTKILKPLIKVEVLSNKGWEEIDSLNISYSNDIYEIKTNKNTLQCTGDHILIDENGNEIFAKDSLNKIILNKNNNLQITSVKKLNIKNCKVYDLSLKGNNNVYYINDLLSHNCLIIDEMAFIPKSIMDEFFASVMPVVSSAKNSRVIVVSTPNGTSGLYYDIWVQANSKGAVKNSEGWKAFRIDWFEVPGRDQKWKEKQIVSIGEQRFAQEFGNEFLAGSSNKKLIPDDILDRYKIKLSELQTLDKEFVKGKQQKIINETSDKLYTFTMWHEFDPNKTYLASGDCSEGIGGDTSVLYVWDVTNLSEITMCAKFASNTISLTEFAFITKKILQCYNNPYYICERNGVGGGYLDSLQITYGYQNIVTEGKNNTKGVYSHVSVKSKACLWAREMLTTNGFSFNIYDKELLDEFQTFVKKDTKGIFAVYQALNPAHDDFVMAFIWMCYILQPDIVEKYFICCQTFSSVLDKIYPKILQPIKPYSDQEIKAIDEEELYKDFISFQAEINDKLKDVMSKKDEQEDYNIMKKSRDPYFQDYDNSPSWNSSSYQRPNNGLNPQGQKPQFFII